MSQYKVLVGPFTYTLFGKTLTVLDAEFHNMELHETPDKVVYKERDEDAYAIGGLVRQGKKVVAFNSRQWHQAEIKAYFEV